MPLASVSAVPARRPLSVPVSVARSVQATRTESTESPSALIVPLPSVTLQDWPTGCVSTVTS